MTRFTQPDGWADRKNRALKEEERRRTLQKGSNGWWRYRTKPYRYIGCCVTLNPRRIEQLEMVRQEVPYSQMRRACDLVAFSKVFDYKRNSNQGITLKDDRNVRFYRSVISSGKATKKSSKKKATKNWWTSSSSSWSPSSEYAGEYYYLDHSRIEWVWRKR